MSEADDPKGPNKTGQDTRKLIQGGIAQGPSGGVL